MSRSQQSEITSAKKKRNSGPKKKPPEEKQLRKEVDELLSVKQQTQAQQQILQLESLLQRSLGELERLRSSRYSLTLNPGKRKASARSFYRVCIPDTHGSFMQKDAFSAMHGDLIRLRPREVIFLGDHLECSSFLAEHQTLGYVADADYSYADDQHATNLMLDAVQNACGDIPYWYLEGNHERRIERWVMTQRLRNKKDAQFLLDQVGPKSVLSVEKRGIVYIAQREFYGDVRIPGTIKLGKCYYTHGSYTGVTATRKHLIRFNANVVHGHTHSEQAVTIRTVNEERIGGWSPGCLCGLQPLWMHTSPTEWTHGYGLQVIQSDGAFIHINVPILNGVSYLGPLLDELQLPMAA